MFKKSVEVFRPSQKLLTDFSKVGVWQKPVLDHPPKPNMGSLPIHIKEIFKIHKEVSDFFFIFAIREIKTV